MLMKTFEEKPKCKYWHGPVKSVDDLGHPISDTFIDGATTFGPWAIMSPSTHRQYGKGLGLGRGQKYEKQADGMWLKVEG
jgi:hypothetical protein